MANSKLFLSLLFNSPLTLFTDLSVKVFLQPTLLLQEQPDKAIGVLVQPSLPTGIWPGKIVVTLQCLNHLLMLRKHFSSIGRNSQDTVLIRTK